MKTTDDIIRDTDLICFSHLRWDTDYQRPQHFMARFSTLLRVFYIEEPVLNLHISIMQSRKLLQIFL